MNPLPRVSVIVVTLNGADLLRKCLEGVRAQTWTARETLVVDNGSTEDIAGMLQREFPDVRLIRLSANTGFAGGNNAGLREARGEYAALLNNDAVPDPHWLEALVACAERDPRTGMVACVIEDGNTPGILDSRGVGIALDGMSRQTGKGRPLPAADESAEVLIPSGCACLIRMDAIREAGVFDERFFAYCEDTDLGLRLLWRGWQTQLAPGARVTHFYSRTGGRFSRQKVFWVERNHYWVAVKNFPTLFLLAVPFMTLWRFAVQAWALCAGSGSMRGFLSGVGPWTLLATVARAQAAALRELPAMWRQRRAIRRTRRVSDGAMMQRLWRHRISMYQIVTGGH